MKSQEIVITIIIIVVAFLIIDWLYKPNYKIITGGTRTGWMYVRPVAAKMIIKYLDRCAFNAYNIVNEQMAVSYDDSKFTNRSKIITDYINDSIKLSYIMNTCFNSQFGSFFDWDVIICRNVEKVKQNLVSSEDYLITSVLLTYNAQRKAEREAYEKEQEEKKALEANANKVYSADPQELANNPTIADIQKNQFTSTKSLHNRSRLLSTLEGLPLFGTYNNYGKLQEKLLPKNVQDNLGHVEDYFKDLDNILIHDKNLEDYKEYERFYNWVCKQWKLEEVNKELNDKAVVDFTREHKLFDAVNNNENVNNNQTIKFLELAKQYRSRVVWNFMNPLPDDVEGNKKLKNQLKGHFGFMFEYIPNKEYIDNSVKGKNISFINDVGNIVCLYNTLHYTTDNKWSLVDSREKYKFDL